jgi:hypothetical protein
MSTQNLTLYNLEATLMRLMFEREELAGEAAVPGEEALQRQALAQKDIEIREYIGREVKKVDGIAHYLHEFEMRATVAKEEAKRLKARADSWEARHERLETLVKSVMLMSGKSRLDGDSNTLKLVKCPPSVEITQPSQLTDEYQRITVTMPMTLWQRLLEATWNQPRYADINLQLRSSGDVKRSEPEAVKSKIAEALKRGDGVPGCSLVTDKLSLRVE